jgi:hypothetical protein
MFTGPLIYYIAAPFQSFLPDPYVVAAAAVAISAITGIVLAYLVKTYLDEKTAVVFYFLWAVSPLLIAFDRIPWNPNLTILSASLAFIPLFSKKLGFKEILFLSAGVFFGYQAHFSGLFLLPLVVLSLFYVHPTKVLKTPSVILIPLAFIASFIPTIVFDLKHDWLNLKGFSSLLFNKDSVDNFMIFSRLLHKPYVIVETIGKVFIAETASLLRVFIGLSFFVSFGVVLKNSSEKKLLFLPLIWMGCIALFYSFYRPSTPEYYFFILLPSILLLVSTVVSQLSLKKLQLICCLFFLYVSFGFFAQFDSFSSLNIKDQYKSISFFNIGEQYKTISFLRNQAATRGVKEIVYDVSPTDSEGFRYLMAQENIPLSQEGNIVHVQFPYTESLLVTERYSNEMSVWIDSRTDQRMSYLVSKDFILKYPKDIEIYESHSVDDTEGAVASYVIFQNQQKIAQIKVIDKEVSWDSFASIKALETPEARSKSYPNNWKRINDTTYIQEERKFGIVLRNVTTSATDLTQDLTFIF